MPGPSSLLVPGSSSLRVDKSITTCSPLRPPAGFTVTTEDPEDELSICLDLLGAVFASFSSLLAGLSASAGSTNDELAVLKP